MSQPDDEKRETVEDSSAEEASAAADGPAETATEDAPLELDEGPRPQPVDEVQEAIFEGEQKGIAARVDIDNLPEPLPELDEGPRPGPVDEVQEALFEAVQEGVSTEVEFDRLPEPEVKRPQKVVKFQSRPTAPVSPAAPAPSAEFPAEMETSFEQEAAPDLPAADLLPRLSEFWLLLALFVVFRGLTLLLLRPGGFIRDWSDFDTYLGIAALSDYGLYPFRDFWLEWPPLVPWLGVAAYRLSLLLPPWPDDPRLWFVLLMGGAFVLFEIGNFVLIFRLARRLFTQSTTISRVLWLYALLFPPVYAMLGFFDGVALFFILLALDLLLDDRRFSSAIAVGVGFMVKIIPVLMLPVALRQLWHRYRNNSREARVEMGLYGVVFGLTVLVLLLPFLLVGPEWVLASARAMAGRASWETVWAVLEGYYGFGVVLGDRLNPAETGFAAHPATLPWPFINVVALGLYLFLFTRPANYRSPRSVVAFAGLTIAVFMLFNKGYSPQFLVYLLPFIILLFPTERGVVYALIYTALNVLEQPIYFVLLPDSRWLLTLVVTIRFGVTLLVGLEFAWILWPSALASLAAARERVPAALAILAAVALLAVAPFLGRAYYNSRLKDSPVAVLSGFLQAWTVQNNSRPPLLVSEQTIYRELYPALHRLVDLRLSDGAVKFKGAPSPAALLADATQAWILPAGEAGPSLQQAAERRGKKLVSLDFAGLGSASLYDFQGGPAAFIAPARFVGGIELLAHRVQVSRGAVDVSLYWRAVTPQAQSYTVFTQLLDADGQRVAGHDGIPANGLSPTDRWAVNTVYADPHRIDLPPNLPPGEYTLVVGLYNRFNERLRGIDPNGFGFANRAVPVGTFRLP